MQSAPSDDVEVSPLHALQLLAAVPLAAVCEEHNTAAGLATAVIDWVWRDPEWTAPLQRQLVTHHEAPFWPSPEECAEVAAAVERTHTTPLARTLAAALQQHCPGTSLADVRRWALMLRCTSSVKLRGPEAGALQLQALRDYQLLLASHGTPPAAAICCGAACFQLAQKMDSWLPDGYSPARWEQLAAFAKDTQARAEGERCECTPRAGG